MRRLFKWNSRYTMWSLFKWNSRYTMWSLFKWNSRGKIEPEHLHLLMNADKLALIADLSYDEILLAISMLQKNTDHFPISDIPIGPLAYIVSLSKSFVNLSMVSKTMYGAMANMEFIQQYALLCVVPVVQMKELREYVEYTHDDDFIIDWHLRHGYVDVLEHRIDEGLTRVHSNISVDLPCDYGVFKYLKKTSTKLVDFRTIDDDAADVLYRYALDTCDYECVLHYKNTTMRISADKIVTLLNKIQPDWYTIRTVIAVHPELYRFVTTRFPDITRVSLMDTYYSSMTRDEFEKSHPGRNTKKERMMYYLGHQQYYPDYTAQ